MTQGFLLLDWYDLPLLYDMVFAPETDREAQFLESMHRRYGSGPARWVLEPACGSGRLVEAMLARGYGVLGFDANENMLRYTRARVESYRQKVQLTRQLLEQFRFRRRCQLAHCLVSTFKYLIDESSARSHLRCVAEALAPKGIYVLGFHLSEYGSTSCSRERWIAHRNGVHLRCNIQTWPPNRRLRLEKVRARLIARRAGEIKRYETEWWFRTYDVRQVRRLVESVPSLEHVGTYDFDYDANRERSLDGQRLDVVLVLRKRN